MFLRRILLTTILAFSSIVVISAELSVQERIRLHKEWLEKKAALKTQSTNTSYNNSLDFHRRITKDGNQTENDIKKENFIGKTRFFQIENRSQNDVYPEIEKDTENTSTTSTTTSSTNERIAPTPNTFFPITLPTHITTTTVAPEISNKVLAKVETTTIPENSKTKGLHDSIKEDLIPDKNNSNGGNSTSSSMTVQLPLLQPLSPSHETLNNTKKPRVKKYPRWGPWSRWSECSRSCGTGVMYQTRKCISRKPNSGKHIISKECAGLYRRYHLCNEQDCPPEDVDFRHQQCSNFDDIFFQGQKYKWEPYVKADAECELNCKPIGMKYFATLNETVIDGTPCTRPAEYYRKNYHGPAICVAGICKAVHASGVITGSFANSGTINCGALICRPISGIFTKNPLPGGYTHVATIPAGASNISVTELKSSPNYLVLKIPSEQKYIFNGGYTLSSSGAYEAVGTIFDYRRIDSFSSHNDGKRLEGVTEWITSTGPTLEPIQIMVFGQDSNPGVKYEYLLPIISNSDLEEDLVDEVSSVENDNHLEGDGRAHLKSGSNNEGTPTRPAERRRRRFNWKVVGFSPCSKSCGGGVQNPIIRCVKETTARYYAQRRCSHSEKPVLNENLLRCNTQPCPAYWKLEDWGDCFCQDGEGYREREVHCVQELANGIVIQVNNAACFEEEPTRRKKCDCPRISRRRPHRQRVHAHARAPDMLIGNNTNQRRVSPFQNEKSGNWLISEWSQQCSAECGTGVEYRSIFCDRSPPNTEMCDLRFTPDSTRPCESDKHCEEGEWFAGPWKQCSGDCFNLTKSRQVICIRNQLIVDDEECSNVNRPPSLQNCSIDEVEYCKPRWHYSTWTDCSKTCGGGSQRRTVKCLEVDLRENTLKESQKCRYSKREPIFRQCNTHRCQDPRVDLIQNDIAPDCVDEFTNCHLIVKAKLCSYEYYEQNCCYSCRGENIEA